MKNQIATLAQAEQHLRNNNIVRTTKSMLEVVEGKQLLTVCGFKYTDRTWTQAINRQIKNHNLVENEDYRKVIANIDVCNQKAGAKKITYVFDLNTANHILLAAMTSQGKQARQQAINAVNKPVNLATACNALPDLNDPIAVLKAFTASLEYKKDLELKLEIAQPKVEFYDHVVETDHLYDMNTAADMIGAGRNSLMKKLRDNNVLMASNTPYRTYIERGYFEVKVNGAGFHSSKVTPKGLAWLQSNYKFDAA